MLLEKQLDLCPDFTKITHILWGHKHISYAEFHGDGKYRYQFSRPTKLQQAFTALIFTYLFIPWNTVLEKLIGSQVVQNFPKFYGNRNFITAFTSARHLSLS
jgi:hypothetical protein